jgi:hypothetical protein
MTLAYPGFGSIRHASRWDWQLVRELLPRAKCGSPVERREACIGLDSFCVPRRPQANPGHVTAKFFSPARLNLDTIESFI